VVREGPRRAGDQPHPAPERRGADDRARRWWEHDRPHGRAKPETGIVSPKTLGGTYGALVIDTDDADAIWQRALASGATVFHPIADTFWGERFGQVIDPFGHRWGFAQHLRDVPHDEVVKAAGEMFGESA
jgi:hypothetical protein